MPSARSKEQGDPLLIDLALQGGGAHGAFTWGVLDRLLEDETLRIDGVSGTSAGAMNAAVLADGYADGGRWCARRTGRILAQGVGGSALQPFSAWAPRYHARSLDPR